MDFAIPDIGVSIETDGAIYHDPIKDAKRDKELATYGWRVVRFNEDAINSNMGAVQAEIEKQIKEAAEDHMKKRKKAFSTEYIKTGQTKPYLEPKSEYIETGSDLIIVTTGVIDDGTDIQSSEVIGSEAN